MREDEGDAFRQAAGVILGGGGTVREKQSQQGGY